MFNQKPTMWPALIGTERTGLLNKESLYEYSLAHLHQIYEANYHRLTSFALSEGGEIHCTLPEQGEVTLSQSGRTRYTSLLKWHMVMPLSSQWTLAFEADIRLYHDVKMAEIISLKTSGKTVNTCDLYRQPHEKFHINCLLYEWLCYVSG